MPQDDRDALGGMATSLKGALDSLLKEARDTQDQLIFARPEAQAKQNAWLTLLRRTANEALAIVAIKVAGGSKDHPQVREFLPNLLATITGKKIAERPIEANAAANRLAGIATQFPEKAELVARLGQAAEGARAAVNANSAAWDAWSKERSEEVVAKGRLRLELEKVHRQLGARFPGQRDFVESFFLRGARPSEGGGEDEEDEAEG